MDVNAEHRFVWATDEEHVTERGAACPNCGCTEITGQFVETGGGAAQQEMGCENCGAEWIDVYKLTGYL